MKFKGSGRFQNVTLLGDDHVLTRFTWERHRHVQMTSNGSLGAVSAVHSKVWFFCRKCNIFVVGIACGDFVLSPYFVLYVVICVLSSFGWRRNLHFVLDWINF